MHLKCFNTTHAYFDKNSYFKYYKCYSLQYIDNLIKCVCYVLYISTLMGLLWFDIEEYYTIYYIIGNSVNIRE